MKWLILILLLPILLLLGALLINQAPLLQEPGLLVRLKLYLTTHIAATRPGHERPELHALVIDRPQSEVQARVIEAMRRLEWDQIRQDGDLLRAVVVTPLWRFKDDVEVQLRPTEVGVEVNVRSQSRVGRGDLGANTRHILDLYHQLETATE
jgi:hypothetical protein